MKNKQIVSLRHYEGGTTEVISLFESSSHSKLNDKQMASFLAMTVSL